LTLSQNTQQESSLSDSAYFLCYTDKETGDIFFKCGWADSLQDIQNFAFMMSKINSGDYENNILDVLKSETEKTEDFETFMQMYLKYRASEKNDLVVPPSMVQFK
jgi:hypothetical protein